MKLRGKHIVLIILGCYMNLSYAQTIETVAGSGTEGYSGDSGPAINAELNHPWAIRKDANGNLYFTDVGNHCVRKIDANTNTITTFFGTGSSGDGPTGSSAQSYALSSPSAMTISGNEMFVTDYSNHKIYKVNLLDNSVDVLAGTGTGGYTADGNAAVTSAIDGPQGIAIGTDGLVYFTESANHVVRRIETDGTLYTIAGVAGTNTSTDGPVATATINFPFGLAIDAQNNVYVAETIESKIRKIDQTSGLVTTFAGTGNLGDASNGTDATLADISTPHELSFDANGSLYFADNDNNKIKKIYYADNKIYTVAGTGTAGYSGDGGDPLLANMSNPLGIYVASNGDIYFSDLDADVIRVIQECEDPDIPQILVSNDMFNINCGESVKLSIGSGSLNSATEWKWYAGSCGGDEAGAGTMIEPSLLLTTTFFVRGEGQCTVEGLCDSVTITVNPCDTIMNTENEKINAFSPNNDGINDFLFLNEVVPGVSNFVQIFNRWGDPVKTFSNYDNESIVWYGTDEFGKSVGGGTYFYIFESDNTQSTNWVIIVK
ncbi:MAG: gliding motility-associated C-terminal domain-containing protein [Crocinitomicaceae bacterium]